VLVVVFDTRSESFENRFPFVKDCHCFVSAMNDVSDFLFGLAVGVTCCRCCGRRLDARGFALRFHCCEFV